MVDEDNGDARGAKPFQVRRGTGCRSDEDPVHSLLAEQVQIGALSVYIFVTVAEKDREMIFVRPFLRSAGHRGEERVARVKHDHADAAAAPRAQLSRGVVAYETEFIDRRHHSL